jgi:phage terminase small subunit
LTDPSTKQSISGSALDTLTIPEKVFVTAYTTPGPTLGNGTQSVLVAKPHLGYDTARVKASEIIARSNVRTAINEIMDKLGLTEEVRADRIKSLIAHGKTSKVVMSDGEGNVRQVIEQPIKAADVFKGIDLLNKMDGTYDRAALPTKLAEREYDALRRQATRALRNEISRERAIQAEVITTPTPESLVAADIGPTANDTSVDVDSSPTTTQPQGDACIVDQGAVERLEGVEGLAGVSDVKLSASSDDRNKESLGGDEEYLGMWI